MFEHALLNGQRKRWTFAVSLTLQFGFAAAVLVLSLWHVENLPAPVFRQTLPSLAPEPVRIVAVPARAVVGSIGQALLASPVAKRFFAPSRVPRHIQLISDDVSAPAAYAGASGALAADGFGRALGGSDLDVVALPPPAPPSHPAVSVPKPLRIGGQVLEAQMLRRMLPVYPPLAKQARISGRVELLGVIGKDGHVQNLQVVSGHPLLVKAALDAVRQWLYRPTLLNGEPVEVTAPIVVQFTLGQ